MLRGSLFTFSYASFGHPNHFFKRCTAQNLAIRLPSQNKYSEEDLLKHRKMPLRHLAPSLPAASLCGPLIGSLYRHCLIICRNLFVNGLPLTLWSPVRPSDPLVLVVRIHATCSTSPLNIGCLSGTKLRILFSKHKFDCS